MSTTPTPKKYIRTEPPAVLVEPLTVTLEGYRLELFNAFRQAQHAWLSCPGDDLREKQRRRAVVEEAGVDLAIVLGHHAKTQLGEPEDWADV